MNLHQKVEMQSYFCKFDMKIKKFMCMHTKDKNPEFLAPSAYTSKICDFCMNFFFKK